MISPGRKLALIVRPQAGKRIWPSVATLLVLLGAHAAVESTGMPREAERIGLANICVADDAFDAVLSTNLRGAPRVPDVPWADLDPVVNRDGELLAVARQIWILPR